MTHICVSKLTIIGSNNGLPPDRRQAIIWTNARIWLIRTLGTNFSEILGEIHSFSFKKMHLKMSSAKGRLFSLGLNVLSSIRRLFSSKSTKLFRFYRMKPWWRHQMETFSALLAICAGNYITQRPLTRSFDVFFDLRPNKRLSKQWRGWWFETPSHPLWRHCNAHERCDKR